jgi:hypothetical protein
MLVGVGDAPVVLFLELVLDGIRRGIAAQPELLDELLALFVGLQALESGALLVGDDVGDVLVQPSGAALPPAQVLFFSPITPFFARSHWRRWRV